MSPNLGFGGIKVRFTGGTGGATITYPTTPTPPITHGKAGFVRILGTANANTGTVVTVPVASAVRAGRHLVVWAKPSGNTTPTKVTYMTAVTDSKGSTYTVHSSGFDTNPQFVATTKLTTPLVTGDVVRATFTKAPTAGPPPGLGSGAGVTVIVAVYFGLGAFTTGFATRFAGTSVTRTFAAAPTGLVIVGTYESRKTPEVAITPTASWKKRVQTRYTAGRLNPTNAPELITMVLADQVFGPTSSSRLVKATWNETGFLGLWGWQI